MPAFGVKADIYRVGLGQQEREVAPTCPTILRHRSAAERCPGASVGALAGGGA
jgi:hypothetical protein